MSAFLLFFRTKIVHGVLVLFYYEDEDFDQDYDYENLQLQDFYACKRIVEVDFFFLLHLFRGRVATLTYKEEGDMDEGGARSCRSDYRDPNYFFRGIHDLTRARGLIK